MMRSIVRLLRLEVRDDLRSSDVACERCCPLDGYPLDFQPIGRLALWSTSTANRAWTCLMTRLSVKISHRPTVTAVDCEIKSLWRSDERSNVLESTSLWTTKEAALTSVSELHWPPSMRAKWTLGAPQWVAIIIDEVRLMIWICYAVCLPSADGGRAAKRGAPLNESAGFIRWTADCCPTIVCYTVNSNTVTQREQGAKPHCQALSPSVFAKDATPFDQTARQTLRSN